MCLKLVLSFKKSFVPFVCELQSEGYYIIGKKSQDVFQKNKNNTQICVENMPQKRSVILSSDVKIKWTETNNYDIRAH